MASKSKTTLLTPLGLEDGGATSSQTSLNNYQLIRRNSLDDLILHQHLGQNPKCRNMGCPGYMKTWANECYCSSSALCKIQILCTDFLRHLPRFYHQMTVPYLETVVPNMAVGLFKFIKEFWVVLNIAV